MELKVHRYQLKTGFEMYGKNTVAAMFKEYQQLYDQTVFGAINPDTLSI